MIYPIEPQDYSILLVDDDQDLLDEEEVLLKKTGYNTYTTQSGERALEILKTTHIDIIVIDYYMSRNKMTGEETIAKIREFDTEVVIILQTGFSTRQPAMKMLESLNIQGYFDKTDGFSKLLIWILSAARACQQIREMKNMIQKIDTAHHTLQQIREDQTRIIEQVRLASLGQKMGSIFHDMSNPLSAIQSNIDLINAQSSAILKSVTDDNLSSDEIQNTAKEIEKRCDSCNQRIRYIVEMRNNVVAQSRQEVANKWEKFLISEMIEQVRFFAEDDVKKYKCTISIKNQVSDFVKISGKKVSLVQALGNLITNSAQAYQNGGNIEINISEKDEFVEFTVKDWAGGIPSNVKEKLFTEMVTTKGTNGSGVGVYSTYLTVTDYFKGKMWFECIEREGTTFYIAIPCANAKSS